MTKLLRHKCGETELKCFDCRAAICRDCMVQTSSSLLCQGCKSKLAKAAPFPFADGVKLEAASVSYSFVAFGLLSFFTGCVT